MKMKLSDDFMKHFRWITPLLLGFNIWMLKEIYLDFKELKADVVNLKVDMATIKGVVSYIRNKDE